MSYYRGNLIVSLFVSTLLFLFTPSFASFSWTDCGAPLTKAISYSGVSMYPEEVDISTSLAVNVQAYAVRQIKQGATTTILVQRNGELFMNSSVKDLCSILTSNNFNCPYAEGELSYTYKIEQAYMPLIPGGDYVMKIRNYFGSDEIGCLEVSGSVKGEDKDCVYESTFNAKLTGETTIQADITGQTYIQVGPNGPLGIKPWGTFVNFDGSTDDMKPASLGAENFVWGLSGVRLNSTTSGTQTVDTFKGNVVIGFNNAGTIQVITTAAFQLRKESDSGSSQETLSGTIALQPTYAYFEKFMYPISVGNLGLLSFQQSEEGNNYVVKASRTYCQCAVDTCGVCGGDGSKCGGEFQQVAVQADLSVMEKASIAIGIIGFFVLVALIVLVVFRRKFFRPVNDDLDLLDPQKPDYGTMAINDIMNEAHDGDL